MTRSRLPPQSKNSASSRPAMPNASPNKAALLGEYKEGRFAASHCLCQIEGFDATHPNVQQALGMSA